MNEKTRNEFEEEFKNICKKYEFKFKKISNNQVALCAKDTDRCWQEWIILDKAKKDIVFIGNTDQCNLWFYETRSDMTPEKIINFTAELNDLLRKVNNTYIKVRTLIDPEDWQEIANVRNAYKDNRYKIQLTDFEVEDNYINFCLMYEEYKLDGLFRIHDLKNGPDMVLVGIHCDTESDRSFVNAHWEEIEDELYDYVEEHCKEENCKEKEVNEV